MDDPQPATEDRKVQLFTMKAVVIEKLLKGIGEIKATNTADPEHDSDSLMVDIKAAALNFFDM